MKSNIKISSSISLLFLSLCYTYSSIAAQLQQQVSELLFPETKSWQDITTFPMKKQVKRRCGIQVNLFAR